MTLEKKLKQKAEWICKHCSQVFDDFEEARNHESIEKGQEHHLRGFVDMLDVKFAIKEVAQKIDEEIDMLQFTKAGTIRTEKETEAKIESLKWVLGLLVDEEEKP